MPTSNTTTEKLLQRRKLYVRFIVILMLALLIGFNIGSWLFLSRMNDYLETELEKRLSSIAELAAKNIEFTPGILIDDIAQIDKQETPGDYLRIQGKLRNLQSAYELEGVYIIDHQFRVLLDSRDVFTVGEKLTYIQQDSAALYQAWSGRVAVSPIHIVEGSRFKTAYAPITNIIADVTALLVLEASADFFEIIGIFKRGLIIGGLATIGAFVLFSIFLSWTVNLLIQTEESLRRSEKLALLGQMSASVAHEIRNPLGVIKATADVLKLKYENKAQPDELFEYIGKEVNRLNSLVSDFLSFARETKLDKKPGNLVETIQKAVTAFERECQEENILLRLDLKNQIGVFNFDEQKIQQTLLNLLVNAKQAIQNSGEITVSLNIHHHRAKKYAEVKIKDTGCGIEGDPQKIFEPFYTTKSSGSGLGLTITRQIVEKHGGWMEVESTKDHGTTIIFYLPI